MKGLSRPASGFWLLGRLFIIVWIQKCKLQCCAVRYCMSGKTLDESEAGITVPTYNKYWLVMTHSLTWFGLPALEIGKKFKSHLPSGDDVWVKSSCNSVNAKDISVTRATMVVAVSSRLPTSARSLYMTHRKACSRMFHVDPCIDLYVLAHHHRLVKLQEMFLLYLSVCSCVEFISI